MLVAPKRRDFFWRIGRAVAHQAMQQKHFDEPRGRRRDADRHKRIQIHQPHFNIFHTTLAQRMQRSLARIDHALGPDRAVKLILNLQQRRRQLVVIAAGILDADGLVRRIAARQCVLQRRAVTFEIVEAHGER